jgi:hypothetical protein
MIAGESHANRRNDCRPESTTDIFSTILRSWRGLKSLFVHSSYG